MHVTKRFHSQDMEMNMTPMIDVVFQLLIFFLVVSEIASYDRVENLTLPEASEAINEQVLPDRLIISIDRFNQIWIARGQRTMEDVKRYLRIERQIRGAGQRKVNQPVLIQADYNSRWQVVQDIIEAANELKFWHLSFAVKMNE
jgi:biopolymer transport protein ExbD